MLSKGRNLQEELCQNCSIYDHACKVKSATFTPNATYQLFVHQHFFFEIYELSHIKERGR